MTQERDDLVYDMLVALWNQAFNSQRGNVVRMACAYGNNVEEAEAAWRKLSDADLKLVSENLIRMVIIS